MKMGNQPVDHLVTTNGYYTICLNHLFGPGNVDREPTQNCPYEIKSLYIGDELKSTIDRKL
jgi:hypothetical protein